MGTQKSFQKGLKQLEDEGAIQVFRDPNRPEPILAAVGELQLDLVQSRLASEYSVETTIDRMNYTSALWISGDTGKTGKAIDWPTRGVGRVQDHAGRTVALLEGAWVEKLLRTKNPELGFSRLSTEELTPPS